MPFIKKDLDKMIAQAEATEVEHVIDTSRDVVGPIGSAITSEEETIIFYKDLLDMFPDFEPVLQDIIAEEEKHIGQLQVLRDNSSDTMKANIEKGVEEAEHQLENNTSEEPDLGEAEVEIADIAIEIPEDEEPIETPAENETTAKGEIPTEGDFKDYADNEEEVKSEYVKDLLNEDTSKTKFVYEGPIYDDYGMVCQTAKEWVYADSRQEAVKTLIDRLKKVYKSRHIHIEPAEVKDVTDTVIENFDEDYYEDADYSDDYEESNLYGGDLTYCPICAANLTHDENGDSYCPECGESAYWLAQQRRKMDKKMAEDYNMSFGSDDFDGEIKAMRDEQKEKEARAARKAANPKVKPGDKIRIIEMAGEPQYTGKEGIVDYFDDVGQIHGTWGGLAIIPEEDVYELVVDECLKETFEAVKAKEDIIIDGKVYVKKGKEKLIRDFTPNGQQFYFDDMKHNFDIDDPRFEHVEKVDLTENIDAELKRTISKLGSAARSADKYFQYKLDGNTILVSHDKSIDDKEIKDITRSVSQRHPNLEVKSNRTSDKTFKIVCKTKTDIKESFDLEDERDILFKADKYKCKLTQHNIDEFIELEGVIEDMEDIYHLLCGKYDDVNIDYWKYTDDGIRVYFCNAKSGFLDIDDSDLI